MSLSLSIAAWAVWTPQTPDALPDVKFIDAMTRRRLGRLARMTLHVANEAARDGGPQRMVYASRHGDLNQTVALLTALAQEEPLSPTAFGMSVHNAIAGVWSILRQDRSAITAISAGSQTFYSGLLEAALQWQEQPQQPLLYVYADDAVPQPYCRQVNDDKPCALALLLGTPAEQSFAMPACEQIPYALNFVRDYLAKAAA